jgi:hypothetical protein
MFSYNRQAFFKVMENMFFRFNEQFGFANQKTFDTLAHTIYQMVAIYWVVESVSSVGVLVS